MLSNSNKIINNISLLVIKNFVSIFIGLFLLILSSQVKFSIEPISFVPITLQTFVVLFNSIIFDKWVSVIVSGFYVLMGIFNINVFANPLNYKILLNSPTIGYDVGFIIAALYIFYFCKNRLIKYYHLVYADIIILFVGSLFLYLMLNKDFNYILHIGVYPYIPGEIIKVFILSLILNIYNKSNNNRLN